MNVEINIYNIGLHTQNCIWETYSQYYPKWTEIQNKETGLSTIPLLFNIVFEALAVLIRQKKEIEEFNIRKIEIKLFLFSDDMILYMRNPQNYLFLYT